ncbi:DST [Lepeophtheirus salmonis]|uniref:DST n=1 Tax=Lepeophtheirus salmonis TaxID=72036 RepID=A0A7R8CWP5_LEPSM|nr:DST [Lepeophtheirus salmonis]CAF2955077.1 DST [Lepeophtheirus salmonis]
MSTVAQAETGIPNTSSLRRGSSSRRSNNNSTKVETEDPSHGVYEENLTKFKVCDLSSSTCSHSGGTPLCWFCGIMKRDAIQKKTFTKWVNKHLKKANRNVRDLFEDLRDGHNLLSLLEVLAGEILPRERGRMRFHAIQNVETALRFLRYKEIKLVNIRGEDIVDGNPKLTLGLIWTIILHFQNHQHHYYRHIMPIRSSSLSKKSSSKFMCCTSAAAGGSRTVTYRENQSKFLWLDPSRWVEKKKEHLVTRMSIYKFVKGSRLFMQGKRHNNDADNVADAFHPTPGTYQGGEDRSSSPYTQQQHSHSQLSNTAHPDDDIRAVHTLRSMRVDGTTEWEKSSKTVKRGGVRSRSSRTVRKITTVTRGEQSVTSESVMSYSTDNSQKYPAIASDKRSLKFRVVDEEDVSAKEALLRWSQKTTQRYPGVKVSDFTQSWRDGLAFNAIIHRNRPDLVDWKKLEKRQVRERIDSAFHIMEREYGVTRLLDPEDVDTPEPDEKSIITYVSQLYDVFPEPPPGHPLFDSDGQKKLQQYKDLSSSLQIWIKEHITLMQDRNFPNTLPEMKRLAEDSHLFRVEHILNAIYVTPGESVDRELHPEALERNWNHLMMLYQERDQLIHDEITRLEKLQRLADKISMEAKMTDTKLDDIESWIEDEAKRVDHLHPKDAKNNCDQIERELQRAEDVIKSMF